MKQPNNQPNIIELQILLVAFGTLGILDNVVLSNVKLLISLGSFIINFLFTNPITEVLTHYFRYLNKKQLDRIVNNLLKFVFVKTNKINFRK